jgi:hypothetical protein
MSQIKGAHVFSCGEYNGFTADTDTLKALVRNFHALKLYPSLTPRLVFGHDAAALFAQASGLPSIGRVERLYIDDGNKLRADFTAVPPAVKEMCRRGAYSSFSVEIIPQFERTNAARNGVEGVTGPYIKRIALLGADAPACHDIEDLSQLVASEEGRPAVSDECVTCTQDRDGLLHVSIPAAPRGSALQFAEGVKPLLAGEWTVMDQLRLMEAEVKKIQASQKDTRKTFTRWRPMSPEKLTPPNTPS